MAPSNIIENWRVPRAWDGETAFILGGGASLAGFDAEILKGRGRVIAIKEAGLRMAPWADVLYWADGWWCDGNHLHDGNAHRLHLHTGRWKITRTRPEKPLPPDAGTVHVLHHERKEPYSSHPGRLAGPDAGANCLNLAALFGARRTVLLGFDMGGGNWDGRVRKPATEDPHGRIYIPAITRMAPHLALAGVEVINATPGSRLTCFPMTGLEEVLDMIDQENAVADGPDGGPESGAGNGVHAPRGGGTGDRPPPARRPDPAPGTATPPVIRDIERIPAPQLERRLQRLAARGPAVLEIAVQQGNRRPPAATVRPVDWWLMKLRAAYGAAALRRLDAAAGIAVIDCRPD